MLNEINWPDIWQALGDKIAEKPDQLELARLQAARENEWFTLDHIDLAIKAIHRQFLSKSKVTEWLENYDYSTGQGLVRVGVVCAGNIPMVGWHDIQCVLTAGHHAVIKLSHKDRFLIPALLNLLCELKPEVANRYSLVDKLDKYDAVIATGSNNSLRYFKSYFDHVPHIFRHNRTSVGIIQEDDQSDILEGMTREIFLHFGMGCRSISKLFVPRSFNLDGIFKATQSYASYGLHSKYRNNFIYHTALFQMNKVDYYTNDLLILLETGKWHAPLSVIYFERYDSIAHVKAEINSRQQDIQVVYANDGVDGLDTVIPGTGQEPQLWDYADHMDTMAWLFQLKEK